MIADINRRIFVAWLGVAVTFLAAWTHGNPTAAASFLTDDTGTQLLTDGSGNPLLAA